MKITINLFEEKYINIRGAERTKKTYTYNFVGTGLFSEREVETLFDPRNIKRIPWGSDKQVKWATEILRKKASSFYSEINTIAVKCIDDLEKDRLDCVSNARRFYKALFGFTRFNLDARMIIEMKDLAPFELFATIFDINELESE